ncbi:MAG: TerC family protein [Phycisphaerales bacterium JB039]
MLDLLMIASAHAGPIAAEASAGLGSALVALAALAALEIVLGIDNLVVISVVTSKLAPAQQPATRRIGLMLAAVLRIGLLFLATWIMKLTSPLFSIFGNEISGKDLLLLGGGGFLIAKATLEIHKHTEGSEHAGKIRQAASVGAAIGQILLLDFVFSLDSVITAVGMTENVPWRMVVMITAILIAIGVMLAFAEPVNRFIHKHPTTKTLALAFILLVGVALVAEGLDVHLPRGYIYSAMAFSLLVEAINLRVKANRAKATAEPAEQP